MDPHTVLNSSDGTRKCLFLLEDGNEIESVIIPEDNRLTICISTQVGCPLACSFCVTGLGGVKRNLRVSEIVGQVQGAIRSLNPGERLTNIVVMGMGEPLLNYDNVVKALRICLSEDGLNFSHRRVTLSTAGVVPNIYRLGRDLPVNLAVSLNATTEELRRQIMPITRRYPLPELLEACRQFPLQHKKQITFEYVMLAGLNDSLEDAARLFKLLKGIKAKVNLIPYNENAWSGYTAPKYEVVKAFQNYLVQRHMMAAVRWSRGPDIGAACGQLGVSRVRVEKYGSVDMEEALE
jgi:23S rRNA (adenine2503-C2)-methyltransferase